MIAKCIHMLMVLAIFNPFCCCTAAVFTVDEASDKQPACCQTQRPEGPTGGCSEDGHDRSNCRHQALKEYPISLEKDSSAKHDLAILLPALLAIIQFMQAEPDAQSLQTISLVTVSNAPPLSLLQVNCVYRI